MTPELKAKWLAALRSGNYKQGESFLRWNDTYCCLGVLCDVARKHWEPVELSADTVYAPDGNGGDQGSLREGMLEELGLSEEAQSACINMNDGIATPKECARWGIKPEPSTFPEIADWLEQNL